MPYKIEQQLPSENATYSEIADFLEVKCFLSPENNFSIVEAAEEEGFVENEDCSNSIEFDSYQKYSDALIEIDERQNKLNNKYPFIAERASLTYSKESLEYYKLIYVFLVLVTRWNMGSRRIVNDLDGTILFERLCNQVLLNFFGNNTKGFVFGTGCEITENSFEAKICKMIDLFKERGYKYRSPEGNLHKQKDGKVDLVTFIPFNDERKGHFVAFGQCKTGTSWKGMLGQMDPDGFCKLYIEPPLAFTPISIYMVAESCDEEWEELSVKSRGLLFDRIRIMEFLPKSIDKKLFCEIKTWVEGIKQILL